MAIKANNLTDSLTVDFVALVVSGASVSYHSLVCSIEALSAVIRSQCPSLGCVCLCPPTFASRTQAGTSAAALRATLNGANP
jgi:hypothetical protein